LIVLSGQGIRHLPGGVACWDTTSNIQEQWIGFSGH